ncbi:MAG: glycosyltransferase [Leptospirales bacterium]|nr:glycosyltransferase [Leptospirales bacterium]
MIFEDPTKRRWRSFLVVFFVILTLGAILASAFAASILIAPPLPDVQHARRIERRVQAVREMARELHPLQHPGAKQKLREEDKGALLALPRQGKRLVTAFLVQDDPESLNSFKQFKDHIDVVFPDWFLLTEAKCDATERIDYDVKRLLDESDAAIIARVTNGHRDKWHTDEMRRLFANPSLRECTASLLVEFAQKDNLKGLNVDIETLGVAGKDNYVKFLADLGRKLNEKGLILTVDITANDPAYDVKAIGAIADGVVLMNYDQHYASGPAGPIASQSWFEANLAQTLKDVPAEKLLVGIATYGIDWGKPHAYSMKFSEVMALADDTGALPVLDADTKNMRFAYVQDEKISHDVWFTNSVTAWNHKLAADRADVAGVAVWRLGAEDPTIWKVLSEVEPDLSSLNEPLPLRSILYLSIGEIFRVHTSPGSGELQATTDSEQFVTSAEYKRVPSGYLLERVGNQIDEKTLLLTFDDGPDPQWTPKILQVLKEQKVPAAFFVVGEQAERYPETLRRIAEDGHLIGNHTYFHPDLSRTAGERTRLEVNTTQRILEQELRRKTLLFRAPYNTDSNPDEAVEIDPLKIVTDMGYIVVGANIDSSDWQKPNAQRMVNRILEQTKKPENHIIVMHDAGGDRTQTVEALKLLIPKARAMGFKFESIDRAAGLDRAALMPPLPASEELLVYATSAARIVVRWGWLAITWLFLFTTLLAIVRIVFLGFLVLKSVRKREGVPATDPRIPVSVLIPAYNEEKTLSKTIESLQRSTHKKFEILVIDDGSTDGSAAVVRELQRKDKRIRLITQPNGGKSVALNHGMREAKHEIVVTIDADTIVMPQTITELASPFQDPQVDAVCGNVEVGNVHNILTGFQSLEYITSQNFDRRAFDALNCISVVPGATGAWRRSKVLAAGGYNSDTLTEDADLTLTMLRANARIVYAPEARARTEAPATIRTLATQRFRWSFGTFQCLWKHRKAFFKRSLGWVALPNLFFFQILFPALSPIGDIVFVLSILRGDLAAIAAGYVLFLFMDLCGSLLAFTLEKKPKRLMLLVLIQRFFYRQFMYFITFKAMFAMLKGRRHGWNKLERQGTVKLSAALP